MSLWIKYSQISMRKSDQEKRRAAHRVCSIFRLFFYETSALSLVFANESDEDDYSPERSRKEPKTPKTPYKGKYEKDLEKLTPEQNQALFQAFESCTSKTAFGHPSDPTFTMEVAERTELDEKLVKAWFRVSALRRIRFLTSF